MRILIISLAGIGDTLMATPLIAELRRRFPDAEIDALVMWSGSRQLLAGNPNLNQVFHCNLIQGAKLPALRFLMGLRARSYDISLNSYPQAKSAYRTVARVIGAKRRISHQYEGATLVDDWLVTDSLPHTYHVHCVENNLRLLRPLGIDSWTEPKGYEIFPTEDDETFARRYVAAHPAEGYLGIHTGSGSTKNLALRRWPMDAYVELIRRLIKKRAGLCVLLFGGPDETRVNREIVSAVASDRVLIPETKSLLEAAALMKRCHSFLSVDTALMHLAAAVHVPRQIVIETPTTNATVTPFGQNFILVKNPISHGHALEYYRYDGSDIRGTPEELERIMRSITVDAVESAVLDTL